MGRSRAKHPFVGMVNAKSEKRDKVMAHKRERRVVKTILQDEDDDSNLPAPKLFGDPWGAAKDGKHRFDPKKLPQLMRK